MDVDVVVAGAGLAGLTAACALHDAGRTVAVIEARPSVGGRIKTLVDGELCLDLGATWTWTNQPAVAALAAEVGVDTFPQHRQGLALAEEKAEQAPRRVDLPSPDPAELRFVAGAQRLCRRLADRLPAGAVRLETEVTVIAAGAGAGMTVTVADRAGAETALACASVVVAVPPRLAHAGITFTPPLPEPVARAMQGTPTWMASAVKCFAVYEAPFWRADGLSGLAFSRPGPLVEIHDACTADGGTAALWGFLSGWHEYRDLAPDARRDVVLDQLGRLFGAEAADPLRYVERDWSNDPYTNDEVVWFDDPLPYGQPALAEPLFDGRLVWAGTETAGAGAGHMEGAVRSGRRAADQVLAAQGFDYPHGTPPAGTRS